MVIKSKLPKVSLEQQIKDKGIESGFSRVAISNCDLSEYHAAYKEKINNNLFGDMAYLSRNLEKRLHPERLVANTRSIITAGLDYYPDKDKDPFKVLTDKNLAYISRYALGRDYHKVFRQKLKQLAENIKSLIPHNYRVFVDSAPVMELNLAQKSGLGWLGKNSCIINKGNGSWFFLGEIYTELELKPDKPATNHCGTCRACLDACPTNAFIEPYKLDPRKCISYLTIEHHGSIPLELRPEIGNRIYGCDDCQLVCPWNRFGSRTQEADFAICHKLDDISLLKLWEWDENSFAKKFEGSAIRRIGYQKWRRNLAVAIGNSEPGSFGIKLLQSAQDNSTLVREHINWAINHILSKAEE